MNICEVCLGFGQIRLPPEDMRTSFGTIHGEPEVHTCPICDGSGRRG